MEILLNFLEPIILLVITLLLILVLIKLISFSKIIIDINRKSLMELSNVKNEINENKEISKNINNQLSNLPPILNLINESIKDKDDYITPKNILPILNLINESIKDGNKEVISTLNEVTKID